MVTQATLESGVRVHLNGAIATTSTSTNPLAPAIAVNAIGQNRSELMLEIMGHQGLGWEGDAFSADELAAVRGWLFGKAFTIFGGSQEVQSNIVSKRILGLPDLTQSK